MNGLRVDFAERPWGRRHVAALVAVLALLAFGVWRIVDASAARATVSPAAPEIARTTVLRESTAPTQSELVLRDTAIPWGRLFDAIESGPIVRQVLLTSLEPSVSSGTVTIEAEANDAVAMAAYLEQLGHRGLAAVTLVRHQPAALGAAEGRIRFSAQAAWKQPSAQAPAAQDEATPSLPARAEVPVLAAELLLLAKVAALSTRAVEHNWANEGGRAPHAAITFDVSGDYRAAREFINQAVGLRPGIALRHLSLRADAARPAELGTPPTLIGRIELRIHVKERP